jgi:RND superfamily putative drug exporter
MYTAIFGLSLDYQVFLISRMREGWERSGESNAAIAYGLEKTAGVVTGAALIMVAVFLAFASTSVAGTKQFGVGMVVAVLIDATVVRLLLLPAALSLLGDYAWGRGRGRRPRRKSSRPPRARRQER